MQMVATLAVQLGQELHDHLAVPRVQVAGGLVGEQEGRAAGDGPGHRHALLLAAGELGGVVVHAVGHLHPLQRLSRQRPAVGAGMSGAVGERQLHVLLDGQVADEVEAWKMKPMRALRMRERTALERSCTGRPSSR